MSDRIVEVGGKWGVEHEVLAVVVQIAENQHPDRVGLVHRQVSGAPGHRLRLSNMPNGIRCWTGDGRGYDIPRPQGQGQSRRK